MIRRLLARIRDDERGEVEDLPALVILLAGVIFVLGSMLFILAQYASADTRVQSAAFAAARDASLSGDVESAGPNARAAAEHSLSGNVDCQNLDVQLDDSGLRTALGETGAVTATVTCTVPFRTIVFPGMPGGTTITKTAMSPTDPYRER